MKYNSILKRLEEDKKSEEISEKLYRYTGLMQAIEFLSQKMTADQIIDSAFEFTNELLTLERSALFIVENDSYLLKKSKNISNPIMFIAENEKLSQLAVLHGTLIFGEENLELYFSKEVLDKFQVKWVLPLIIDVQLIGFIFVSCKFVGNFTSDDYIISEALMRLYNNALENCKRFQELQHANRELDEKIFNMFAINQSSKALLSELSIDMLHCLSVDVFSELTQSLKTGFILYDEKSEMYILKGYKDVYHRTIENINIRLHLNDESGLDMNKIIIDVSNPDDCRYFNKLFEDGIETVQYLEPLYLVILLSISKKKILGIVTLGSTATGNPYKKSIFELIESLASSTYIAYSNADLMERVNKQKQQLQNKLNRLMSLNSLMKNINSSKDADTLLELTMRTLEISFGVEKGCISLYDKDKSCLEMRYEYGMESTNGSWKLNSNWQRLMEGKTICEASSDKIRNYLDEDIDHIDKDGGILSVPFYIDSADNIDLIGAVTILKFKEALINDEEQILIIETIANHISPVLANLFMVEEQRRLLQTNFVEVMKDSLAKAVTQAREYGTRLEVFHIKNLKAVVFYEDPLMSEISKMCENVYPVSYNQIFIIVDKDYVFYHTELMDFVRENSLEMGIYRLGRDFNTQEEFYELVSGI